MTTADVDVTVLKSSGASILLHSLTERMLAEKPTNPVEWMRSKIANKTFYLHPKHMRHLLANASTIQPELLLACVIDVAPPNFQTFYNNPDAEVETEFGGLLLEIADVLSNAWSSETLNSTIGAAAFSQFPLFARTALDLAKSRQQSREFVAVRERKERELQVQQKQAVATGGGEATEEKEKGADVEQSSGSIELPRTKFHLDILLPLETSETVGPHEIRRALALQQTHLAWALKPFGDDASYHLHLGVGHDRTLLKGHHDAIVIPTAKDIAQETIHSLNCSSNVSVVSATTASGSSNAYLASLSAVLASRREEAGKDKAHNNHVVVALDSINCSIHLGSVVRLCLPILESDSSPLDGVVHAEKVEAAPQETAKATKGKKGAAAAAAPAPQKESQPSSSGDASFCCVLPSSTSRPTAIGDLTFHCLWSQLLQPSSVFRSISNPAKLPAVGLHSDLIAELVDAAPDACQGSLSMALFSSTRTRLQPSLKSMVTADTSAASTSAPLSTEDAQKGSLQFVEALKASAHVLQGNKKDAAADIESLYEKMKSNLTTDRWVVGTKKYAAVVSKEGVTPQDTIAAIPLTTFLGE